MPSRLVYAPKAYVYTKSQNGTLNNLSPYVTAGNVQRKINQVSSATVTLRNPLKMFTGGQGQPRIFHPMDPITIYLERAKGYPVRVFTGYLDNTPYYQMYPGTCTLQASCTLKRLLYTFFDPSLPYVIAFFKQYGWYNSGSGSIISSATLEAGDVSTQAAVMSGKKPFTDLKDGSLAKLLWATLYDIGQWKDTAIYIENLPTGANGIAARMAKLMQSTQQDEEQAANDFTQFLHLVIGANSQGSGGGPGASGTGGGAVTSTLLNANQRAFASALSTSTGLDPNVVAAWVISEEPASASHAPNGANNWLNIGATDAGFYGAGNPAWSDPAKAGQFTANWMRGTAAPGFGSASQGIRNILKTTNQSPQAQIRAIQQSGWASGAYPNMLQTYQTIVNHSKAHSPEPAASTQVINASNVPAPSSNVKVVFPFPKNSGYAGQSQWHQDDGVDISAPGNTPELAMGDGTVVKHGIGGFGNWAPVLKLDQPIMGHNYIYYGHAGPNGLVAVGTHVKAGQQITSVYNGIAGISTGPHIEIGFCDRNGTPAPGSAGAMFQTLKSAEVGNTVPGGGGSSGGSGAAGSDPSGGQAFVAELNFPSVEDSVTAIALGAEHKGLMHDQSLLPFVQQITQASLRSFQSLPNGCFYAFYPDYFGEMGHHKPYWLIHDIEILSGGINLSDDSLATHVFAVGDNTMIDVFGGNSGSNELVNMLFSSGCINIFNAFVTTGILDTKGDKEKLKTTGLTPGIMNAKEAVDFIKRYGARPLVQNYPMVRSSIFEMLLAYQQFMFAWSNQFKTPFTFTFMPELYPGGKVGFPEHGLQMYINSVTHDWNYEEGGFTTTADLTAPSILDGANPNDFPELPPNMVRALVEPVGT